MAQSVELSASGELETDDGVRVPASAILSAIGVPSSPTTYTQTYATAAQTVSAATALAAVTTAATQSTPFGYVTQAQADAVVAAVNALILDVLAIRKVQNSLIDDLQSSGLVA